MHALTHVIKACIRIDWEKCFENCVKRGENGISDEEIAWKGPTKTVSCSLLLGLLFIQQSALFYKKYVCVSFSLLYAHVHKAYLGQAAGQCFCSTFGQGRGKWHESKPERCD